MAFGISKLELSEWKQAVLRGEVAYLTHYWLDPRFPEIRTVTKVGCADLEVLVQWCRRHELNPAYIHRRDRYPHFDLMGEKQKAVLAQENQWDQIARFNL